MSTVITIEPVTRIEGHARVKLEVDDRCEIISGALHVLEIRGFEKLLSGMELLKMPMITGRICGVCPAAHHLAAAGAIEQGAGVEIPSAARGLRELLYMGHLLHSHALSCFALVGPDLLSGIAAAPDQRNIFSLLVASPDVAKKALRLRTIGQRIVETVGGRGVHPVTAIAGGMSCRPDAESWKRIGESGKEAVALLDELRPALLQTMENLADIRAAAFIDMNGAALSNNGVVDFLSGQCRIVSAAGEPVSAFNARDYASSLVEHVMPGSYMKSVRQRGTPETSYFVGPLARALVNNAYSTPRATDVLREFKNARTSWSALDNIAARLMEMVHCAERIVEITSDTAYEGTLAVPVSITAGRYIGMVEAPRGILIHDYTADENGRVRAANLIVATQNNYDAINDQIVKFARFFKPHDRDELLLNGVEFGVRCFDPCLACATHAMGKMPLTIELTHQGEILRTITREKTNGNRHQN